MKRNGLRFVRFAAFVLVIAAVCSIAAYAAEVKVGTVSASTLNLRERASTASGVLGQAKNGAKVVVLEKSGDWYKVIYNQVQGYMHSDYLKISSGGDFSVGKGVINGSSVNFRKTLRSVPELSRNWAKTKP